MTSGVRTRLATDLTAQYDKVLMTLEEAMDSTRKAWAFCPDCKKKVQVDHPDHSARLKATELWIEHALGRAGTANANETAVSGGARELIDDLASRSSDELAAFIWLNSTEEERAREREFAERVKAEVPDGLFDALERIGSLQRLMADPLDPHRVRWPDEGENDIDR